MGRYTREPDATIVERTLDYCELEKNEERRSSDQPGPGRGGGAHASPITRTKLMMPLQAEAARNGSSGVDDRRQSWLAALLMPSV
jgi:hypothetical protein